MISRKSNRELDYMREAGRIVALALSEVGKNIKAGMTTQDVSNLVEEVILSQGATPSFKGYNGFPAAACVSVNEVLVHGVPSKKHVLKDGDIVSVDVGANYKGYHGDSAWTFAIGNVSDQAKKLMEVTKAALEEGLKYVKDGCHVEDISAAIGKYIHDLGYSTPSEYTGHGIGSELHEDPIVPNEGVAGRGPILREGMTIAIEPMVIIGKPQTKVLKDNWTVISKDKTLTAHYEYTVAITKNGYEILTINKEEQQ